MKVTIKIPVLSSWRGNIQVFGPKGTYTETTFQEALTAANNARGPNDVVTIIEAEVDALNTSVAAGRPVSPPR